LSPRASISPNATLNRSRTTKGDPRKTQKVALQTQLFKLTAEVIEGGSR
jgi:hypothetical protein